jgi:drug/metabolite transporter (DMT)-like permease
MAAVVSLGMLGVLHKGADRWGCRPQAINLFLFFWASVLMMVTAAVLSGSPAVLSSRGTIVIIAAICGSCAGIAILNFQQSMRFGKISTSWLIINLSTASPTTLSIVLYHEHVTLRRGLSLVLAVAALVLLGVDRCREQAAQISSSSQETTRV